MRDSIYWSILAFCACLGFFFLLCLAKLEGVL